MARLIPLTQGKSAIVSDSDFEYLNQFKWCISPNGYAIRNIIVNGKKTQERMHRVIAKIPLGKFTDHINGDKLDNRNFNLRIATKSQNAANAKLQINNTSGFRGVSWDKRCFKWYAYIKFKQKRII